MGPMGKVIRGHVLDCSVTGITRALKDYDPQLYVKWNPKKIRGHGCWEIRRIPNNKTIADAAEFQGNWIIKVDYVENDIINHVLDCAYLNYDAVRKVKEMDCWKSDHWIHRLDQDEEERRTNALEKAKNELRYNSKQIKPLMKAFKDMIGSGLNPAQIAQHWGNMQDHNS